MRQQLLRVFVLRPSENRFAISLLYNFPVPYHHHTVRQGVDDRQVVADDDHAQAVFPLQIGQQFQDLPLPLHVQRAGGFVQHQHRRFDNQGAGDGEPLPLAA